MFNIYLHPKYDYSTLVFGYREEGGYVGIGLYDIDEYIKHVDWLNRGNKNELHIVDYPDKRNTFCLIQRLEVAGGEVFVKNSRSDKHWSKPVYEPRSEEELVTIEIANTPNSRYETELKYATEGVEKYTRLYEKVLENDSVSKEKVDYIESLLEEEKNRLASVQGKEHERIEIVKNFWKNYFTLSALVSCSNSMES